MKWSPAQCDQFMRNRHFGEIPGLLEMATQPHILDRTRRRIRGYLEKVAPHRLVRADA